MPGLVRVAVVPAKSSGVSLARPDPAHHFLVGVPVATEVHLVDPFEVGHQQGPSPTLPGQVHGQAQVDVRVENPRRLVVDLGVGGVHLGLLGEGTHHRPPDQVGEAHLAALGQPVQLVVDDASVDLEQLGWEGPHRRRGGELSARLHPVGDRRRRPAQDLSALGERRFGPGCRRRRRRSARGGIGGRTGGGRGACRGLGGDGGRSRHRPGRGHRIGGGQLPVSLEEPAPRLAQGAGGVPVSLVHLVDEPVVPAESGAGLSHAPSLRCRLQMGASRPKSARVDDTAAVGLGPHMRRRADRRLFGRLQPPEVGPGYITLSRAISTMSLNVDWRSSELVASPVRTWSLMVRMARAAAPCSAATP